jgi:acetyl-CoA C-acetyltransferase
MVELLRQNPAKIGLVQALSWFISKHSVGIYSGEAAGGAWRPLSQEGYQVELDSLKMNGPALVEEASGKATVETFTLFHDREGRPITAVIIGRLDDGSRFLAKPEPDESILNAMMEREVIGERGKVRPKDDFNIFQF